MAKVYVGTYAKYNSGSIDGKWLDLENYSSSEDFHEACLALHSDEADPELMFQDWEDIPDQYISESHLSPDVWEWLEMSDDDKELLAAYQDGISSDGTLKQAQDAFMGRASSEIEFAQQYAEDCGLIDPDARWPNTCIDWDQAARELGYDISFIQYEGETWAFSCL